MDRADAACAPTVTGARCIAQGQRYECIRAFTDDEIIWQCARIDPH